MWATEVHIGVELGESLSVPVLGIWPPSGIGDEMGSRIGLALCLAVSLSLIGCSPNEVAVAGSRNKTKVVARFLVAISADDRAAAESLVVDPEDEQIAWMIDNAPRTGATWVWKGNSISMQFGQKAAKLETSGPEDTDVVVFTCDGHTTFFEMKKSNGEWRIAQIHEVGGDERRACENNQRALEGAYKSYFADNESGTFIPPDEGESLAFLAPSYVNSIMVCPLSGDAYTWVYVDDGQYSQAELADYSAIEVRCSDEGHHR